MVLLASQFYAFVVIVSEQINSVFQQHIILCICWMQYVIALGAFCRTREINVISMATSRPVGDFKFQND